MSRTVAFMLPAALLAFAAGVRPTTSRAAAPAAPRPQRPVLFETALGREPAFLARGAGSALHLTREGAALHLAPTQTSCEAVCLRASLVGARSVAPVPEAQSPGRINYLTGRNRADWRTGVRSWSRVRYSQVYPGVDWLYYGQDGVLEYDFILQPGADPNRIRLRLDGAQSASLLPNGDLALHTAGGTVRHRRPVVYQQTPAGRKSVEGEYRLSAGSSVELGFRLGKYDRTLPLIIDPVIDFSTYHGSGGAEYGTDVTTDSTGAIYVAGRTWSTNFPNSSAAQPTFGGGNLSDAFVTKLDPTGTRIIYSTYLGGSGQDLAHGVAVDSQGSAVVVGETTSTNFPVQSPQEDTLGGDVDAFVTRLSPDGSDLVYSTYLGGTGTDLALGVAVSGSTAYVVGTTRSRSSFPLRNALFSSSPDDYHGFLATYGASGSTGVVTFLGATDGGAIAHSVAVNASGVYVAGQVRGAGVPIPPNTEPYQRTKKGSFGQIDAFVMRLNSGVTALLNATHLGGLTNEGTLYALGPGDGDTVGLSLAADGSVLVTGRTQSTDFPIQGGFQTQHRGGTWEGFVARLSSSLNALTYSSYVGGTGWDELRDVAGAPNGTFVVTGGTFSTDLAVKNAVQPVFGGGRWDGWVASIDPTRAGAGSLLYLTYLGGSRPNGSQDFVGDDQGTGVAVDKTGRAVVTGQTSSSDFPTSYAFNGSVGGVLYSLGSQIFVTRIDPRSSLPNGKIEIPGSLKLPNVSLSNASPPIKELKIKNKGKGPLRLGIGYVSYFEVSTPQPLFGRGNAGPFLMLIPPGETQVLRIRLSPLDGPEAPGTYKQTLKITTNDPAKRTAKVKLQVKVTR